MKDLIVSGLNIQSPWSGLLLRGVKRVETRSYRLPKKHEHAWLALIETPGKVTRNSADDTRHARITGLIKFSVSFPYADESEWAADYPRHRVPMDHPVFGFKADKPKWGWVVEEVLAFKSPLPPPPKRGIVFASECAIPGKFASLIR